MRRTLQHLKRRHAEWVQAVSKFVASVTDTYGPGMDALLADGSSSDDLSLKQNEQALEERLKDTLEDMDKFFAPLFNHTGIEDAFKANTSSGKEVPVVLCIDHRLQDLPWEGLDIFSSLKFSISRDFSLHMMGHRFGNSARSASTRNSLTAASLNSIPAYVMSSPVSIPVSAGNIFCVVDPLKEDPGCTVAGLTRESMSAIVTKVKGAVNGGSKWNLRSFPGPLSAQDWISIAHGTARKSSTVKDFTSPPMVNGALFLYTTGRSGSLLNPTDLSLLNLESMSLVLVSDQGHTDASQRRQSSADNQKSLQEIAAEHPLRLMALISLSGASCVVMPLWSTPLSCQKRFVTNFWDHFTKKKENVMTAVTAGCRIEVGNSKNPVRSPMLNSAGSSRPKSRSKDVSPVKQGGSASANLNAVESKLSKNSHGGSALSMEGPVHASVAASGGVETPSRRFSWTTSPTYRLKAWVTYSKVIYGYPAVSYSE